MIGKKILRNLIGTDFSFKIIGKIKRKASYFFADEKELNFFNLIYDYYSKFDGYPSFEYLDSFFEVEKGNSASDVYDSVKNESAFKDSGEFLATIDFELKRTISQKLSRKMKDRLNELSLASIDGVLAKIEELYDDVGLAYKDLRSRDDKELLVYGDNSEQFCKKLYEKAEKQQGTAIAQWNLNFVDSVIGGIRRDDFVVIAAFTSQGKSTMARWLSYQYLMQGMNVYFETLEMKYETILNHFLTIHANNVNRWGMGTPRILYKQVRDGKLNDIEKNFYVNEVIPDFHNNKHYGSLKVVQPGNIEWTFKDAMGMVKETIKTEMPIDVYVCDYLTLFQPSNKKTRMERDDYNKMIDEARQFGLDHDIAIVTPHQCNRGSYEDMLKDKNHLYTLACLSDYHNMERAATVVVTLAQTDEMKLAGLVQMQCLKNREGEFFPVTVLTVSYPMCHYYEAGMSALSAEASINAVLEMSI